MGSPLALEIEG